MTAFYKQKWVKVMKNKTNCEYNIQLLLFRNMKHIRWTNGKRAKFVFLYYRMG